MARAAGGRWSHLNLGTPRRPGEQLVNVVQGVEAMSLKANLVRSLRKIGGLEGVASSTDGGHGAGRFMPASEVVSSPEGLVEACKRLQEEAGMEEGDERSVWIVKPSSNNQVHR